MSTGGIALVRDLMSDSEAPQSELPISWTEEMQGMRKVKHMGVKNHYVLDTVNTGKIADNNDSSPNNRSDGLNKVIIGNELKKYRICVGVTAMSAIEKVF